MRQLLSPEDIANEIRMTRSLHRGAFVLVEGGTADLRVFERFIDPQRCQIEPVHGKANVLAVIAILEHDDFRGVLGIIDADRSRLTDDLPRSENLVVTDGCDLESMLLHSQALDKVLAELGSKDKIESFEARTANSVREHLADAARPLGALRYVSERDNLGLWFQDLGFSKLVDREHLTIDSARLVRTVHARTVNRGTIIGVREARLLEDIELIVEDHEIPSQDLSLGHDMVEILAIGLRRTLGSRKQTEITTEILERDLRLAYETEDFRSSGLHAVIRDWERRNRSYTVLR